MNTEYQRVHKLSAYFSPSLGCIIQLDVKGKRKWENDGARLSVMVLQWSTSHFLFRTFERSSKVRGREMDETEREIEGDERERRGREREREREEKERNRVRKRKCVSNSRGKIINMILYEAKEIPLTYSDFGR